MVLRALRRRLDPGHGGQEVDRSDEAIPSVIFPDESAWLLWGRELRRFGFAAAPSPLGARVLVAPSRVPSGLVEAVAEAWRQLPEDRHHIALEEPQVGGRPLEEVVDQAVADGEASGGESEEDQDQDEDEHCGDGGGEGHGHHAGAGHGEDSSAGGEGQAGAAGVAVGPPPDVDAPPHPGPPPAPGAPERGDHDVQRAGDEQENMMPIEGDVSTDGLVMEAVEVELGPLGTVLPGGLVARISLDGDIVATCSLEATLEAPRSAKPGALVPDPLAAAAWREAISAVDASRAEGAAYAGGWESLVDVELERAASHLVWLWTLGGLLGWADLVDGALAAMRPLLDVRAVRAGRATEATDARRSSLSPDGVEGPLIESGHRTERLRRLLGDDRRLVRRTRGRGRVDRASAAASHATGPVARAAGLRVDERLHDPRYTELGFEPILGDDGDALARTRLRLEEAHEAVRLARAALERESEEGGRDPAPRADALEGGCTATVEGPRGPIHATLASSGGDLRYAAPGQGTALDLAGRSAVEEEWSAALVALVSFDLSPWRVGP